MRVCGECRCVLVNFIERLCGYIALMPKTRRVRHALQIAEWLMASCTYVLPTVAQPGLQHLCSCAVQATGLVLLYTPHQVGM